MTASGQQPERNRCVIEAAREAMARRDRDLDDGTLSRLRQIRGRALEARRGPGPLWLSAGTAVAAALVIALLWPRNSALDMELFASGEWLLDDGMEIELIEEMEFYQWLAEGALDGHSS